MAVASPPLPFRLSGNSRLGKSVASLARKYVDKQAERAAEFEQNEYSDRENKLRMEAYEIACLICGHLRKLIDLERRTPCVVVGSTVFRLGWHDDRPAEEAFYIAEHYTDCPLVDA